MADFDTPTNCSLLYTWNDSPTVIDHWVASHQILPFFATIYGWDFRWVIIGVYFAETVENTIWCLEKSFHEDISNAVISDPIQGALGAIIGYMYRKNFGVVRDQKEYVASIKDTLRTVVDMALVVAPFTILYSDNRNLDYLLILLFLVAFLIVHREFPWSVCFPRLVISQSYVVVSSLVIFGHPLGINTFYSSIICGLSYFLFLYALSWCSEKSNYLIVL